MLSLLLGVYEGCKKEAVIVMEDPLDPILIGEKLDTWARTTFKTWYPDIEPTEQDIDTLSTAMVVASILGVPFSELTSETLSHLLEALTNFRGRAWKRALDTLVIETPGIH